MTSEDDWVDDLTPIKAADWNCARARHLLNRAGFGGTPEDIDHLAAMMPAAAVERLVDYEDERTGALPAFEHSGVYDATLQVFPPSRPAATRKAETTGEAIGVRVKPGGTRRVQPVVDRFFFWLRATALETRRVAHGGPTAWSPPIARWRRRWRCSGTDTSPPAPTRSATIARCWSSSSCFTSRPPEISASF